MNYILFDDDAWQNLLPLTFTKPVAEIRVGILTISEKWNRFVKEDLSYKTQEYLQNKYKLIVADNNILINSSICPDRDLYEAIVKLPRGSVLTSETCCIAANLDAEDTINFKPTGYGAFEIVKYSGAFRKITYPWEIFQFNGEQIDADFNVITNGRKSAHLSSTNKVMGLDNIFVEESAIVECAILNASSGKIYLSQNSEIMEGSIVRGSFALGEHSALKLGTKIYGPTTVGPYSKIGGEVNNSVIFGYTNKAHDGFLGNSVIGEWCNLGADSNNSNLKNNYELVKLWSYPEKRFINTGLQFCGLIMGDHSKCGINTMFNTGTIVGVSSNIFGCGFPRNFIPSFSWGGPTGMTNYRLDKALQTAKLVMARRGVDLDTIEAEILKTIYEMTMEEI